MLLHNPPILFIDLGNYPPGLLLCIKYVRVISWESRRIMGDEGEERDV